jgi:hypothetical protein
MIGNRQPDIIVMDRNQQPVLVVEVRYQMGTDAEWAKRFRRNLLAHSLTWNARYFMMTTPDQSYVWYGDLPFDAPPTLIIDSTQLWGSDLTWVNLESRIALWLNRLIYNNDQDDVPPAWVEEIGLWEALRDAHLEFGLTA